ncbi:MAG: sugar transferase [Chloroflexi bacterium]|nr:sugar transferase [Chloroflexota bacterium]
MSKGKRALDLILATIGLLVTSPLWAAIALAIKLTSPGPILYRGIRSGRGGVPFTILKFRTMVIDAAQLGPPLTTKNDPRVTAVGRILRRSKLDELPQLINVLRGEMSLVGPRPEAPQYVAFYSPEERRVLDLCPGITGLAQLLYRDEEQFLPGSDTSRYYVSTLLPQKLALDLEYMRRRSLTLDLRILGETFLALVGWPLPRKDLPTQTDRG